MSWQPPDPETAVPGTGLQVIELVRVLAGYYLLVSPVSWDVGLVPNHSERWVMREGRDARYKGSDERHPL